MAALPVLPEDEWRTKPQGRCSGVVGTAVLTPATPMVVHPKIQPVFDVHPRVKTGHKDDLRGRSRVFNGIVVAERDPQICGDIGQIPTPPAIPFGPGAAGNLPAVQPPHPQWPETVAEHRPVEGGPVKASVADEGPSLQQAAEFCIQAGEGRAAPDVLRSNAVQPDVEGPEGFLGVHGEGSGGCNTADSDLNDSYLADAGRTFIGRFDVDDVEVQVSRHPFLGC